MKSLKIKLTTTFIMVAFAIAMLIVGIYAAQTQTITMQGSVNFEIADKSLYMKDVRIQMDNNSDPTSIDDFMPGYINGDFKMNLGSLTNNYGSFALYFDIVNTINEETQESFYYSPSVTCEQDGIFAKVSGAIDIGTVLPENVATADISGTIKLTVINPTETSVDLSKITITISQAEVYTDFVFDDHGTLTAYLGSDSNVTIPSTYSMVGEPELVTLEVNEGEDPMNYLMTLLRITDFTFSANGINKHYNYIDEIMREYDYSVSSIPVPFTATYYNYDNVTFIEGNDITVNYIQGAFAGNTTLQTVDIPSEIEAIGIYSFYSCMNLTQVDLSNKVNLKTIGHCAFQNSAIQNIILNGCTGLEGLEDNAFGDCTGLTGIDLSNCTSLTSIGEFAFRDCSGLTSITLPSSLTSIGGQAFYGCNSLETLEYKGTIEQWLSIDFGIFWMQDPSHTFIVNGEELTNLVVPEGVTSIGESAFFGCSGLTGELVIPEGVTSIGGSAFGRCGGLTSINFSNCTSLTSIGMLAFAGCTGFTSVTMNEFVFRNTNSSPIFGSGLLVNNISSGETVLVPANLIDDLGLTNSYLDNASEFTRSVRANEDGYYVYTKI